MQSLTLATAALVGCTGEIGPPESGSRARPWLAPGSTGSSVGAPGTSSTGEPGTASTGPGGTSTTPGAACDGTALTSSKRIVRLSFNQLASSLGTLVSSELAAKLIADNEIVDAEHRAFPPLQSPREGNSVTDATWKTMDTMASSAAQFAADNFSKISKCGTDPSDACAQEYLLSLADRAFRRPVTAAERDRISKLYSSALRSDAGASVTEAVQYGAYAILQSPQFVYRTEFGEDWKVDGPLTDLELASALAYFLTDDMPDQQLTAAATQGKLRTPAQLGSEVDRLLQTDAARKNLEGAAMSYFAYPQLESVKIDDPAFTDGVRNSMYHEAELFLRSVLWGGVVNDLLLSKQTTVNASLARIYGVAFPAKGVTPDADGFAPITTPEQRMGILTQPGFLTTRSRPDKTSVVGRGLLVKNAFLCSETPPPPEGVTQTIASIVAANPDASERDLANIRATTSPCYGCHQTFDAYGLALDTFDVIGRYRTMDSHGRPIDTSVTLPQQVGGGMARDAVGVAQQLAASGSFATCMGRNFVNYALADVSAGAADLGSCAVKEVSDAFAKSDGTFSSLLRAVVTSQTFIARSKGTMP
jgi:hypothetical protein